MPQEEQGLIISLNMYGCADRSLKKYVQDAVLAQEA